MPRRQTTVTPTSVYTTTYTPEIDYVASATEVDDITLTLTDTVRLALSVRRGETDTLRTDHDGS